MRVGRACLALGFALVTLVFGGYCAERAANAAGPSNTHPDAVTKYIALLRTGTPQQQAAAAYWLGQQHSAAAKAVDPLVELLGSVSEIDPTRYRTNRYLQRLTLGEEAAAALVNIGHPSIEPLIRVLKNSPVPQARKNAAWALGALHDAGATEL